MGIGTNTVERGADPTFPIQLPRAFSDEEFFEFCMLNKNLRIERLSTGKIILMPPTSSSTGNKNSELNFEINLWNKGSRLGKVFDSSSGFTLPNGAIRSPDVSWILQERWDALTKSDQEKFAAICPDFVIELRSASDSNPELREKMDEYITNGCRLAWLVDPAKKQTMVYYPDGSVQVVSFDQKLYGGEVLPGFELIMAHVIVD